MKQKKLIIGFILLCMAWMLPLPVLAVETPPESSTDPQETAEKTYKVTFDSKGGSSVPEQTVKEGTTAARPGTNPTRDGYIFSYWSKDGNTEFDFTEAISADTTLVAVWQENNPPESSYLASLSVAGFEFKEGAFDKNKDTYTIDVPADTFNIRIDATPDGNSVLLDSNSIGNKTLEYGENTFTVITKLLSEKAVGDDLKPKTYTIHVNRKKPDVSLSSLRVAGQVFKETFESDIFHYSLEVAYDTEEVTIQAVATSETATIEIMGATEEDLIVEGSVVRNLVVGDNTIIVSVIDGSFKQEYSITVTRLEEDVEPTPVPSPVVSTPVEDLRGDGDDGLTYILIVGCCILALLMVGLGIFFYVKSRDPEKKRLKEEKKKAKQAAKEAKKEEATEEKTVPEVEPVNEPTPTEELEKTKEAPVIDRSDILEGIEDLFDDNQK